MLRARMDYCAPKGIPLSRFLSWPTSDQEAALAWQAHEGRRCGGCGTHLDDWREDRGGSRSAYHAELYTCAGCAELDRMRENKESKGRQMRLSRGAAAECPHCS